ncbi:phospholipase A1-Igamma1-like isoform [Arachis hypogaea]|nr:phospholipase A1-Igamma1-like isoform [Arachis hypogaea]
MNKSLVRGSNGLWRQPERPRHVNHPENIDHHLNQLGLALKFWLLEIVLVILFSLLCSSIL